jgi:hypothetical protein
VTTRLTRAGRVVVGVLVLALVAGVLATAGILAVRWAWGESDCAVQRGDATVELDAGEAEAAARVVAQSVAQSSARSGAAAGAGVGRKAPRERLVERVAHLLDDSPSEGDRKDAVVVVDALTGRLQGALSCQHVGPFRSASDRLGPDGLVPRAEAVRRDMEAAFGDLDLGGFAPGGVRSGHMKGSAHYEGRAIDVFFRPIDPRHQRQGWALAQYLVANAERLRIATVIFDDQIWTARRGAQGWREYRVDTRGEDRRTAAILEHRDHVHVDVAD